MDRILIRRIVVLGDDIAEYRVTARHLGDHGFLVERCGDPALLLERLRQDTPCLVLLHAAGWTPDRALDLVRRIREVSAVPCILRAGSSDQGAERVRGLESGLDDWAPGDACAREMLARIRAVLRRSPAPAAPEHRIRATLDLPGIVTTAWKLSSEKRDLFAPGGQPCQLTSAEFDLLVALVRRRGAAVSREELSQAVFRRPWYPDDRGIDNLVARLRRKLTPASRNRQAVKPVRGVGYIFTGF